MFIELNLSLHLPNYLVFVQFMLRLLKQQHHRLYRGRNCQTSATLFQIVIVQMRFHEPKKAYVAKQNTLELIKTRNYL